ncbi:SDR family NAD(P)-dependent oxidoreductase [Allonocardiopsis opalescens]|uniref:3-oxoacyl-[acyl-carrier protein] reductase n=1 Tax=Allonocardiopsis opalescens TaxID=1144618 RepID=A0A2T0QEJ2_9ACTN|nr:SDR family oxidoreductase [Allonocardiopsis opalescens]PRY02338.1 3-oxoacyl-[acyl-carrier protein] reductase [Allonocardiopsis opalescens]
MELGLQDRVVLVTGASTAIGRATALAFADERARVAVGYHSNAAAAAETVALAERRGARAVPWRLDLGEPGSLAAAVEQVRAELGPVDVLVNNAVRWPDRPAPGERFETAPPRRFTDSVTANLTGPYLLARAVVGDMRARGWGRIVNVSTGLVEDGFPGSASYVAAKAGLHGLTRVMSRELASAGILTNVVMPGFTPGERAMPPGLMAKAEAAAATGRVSRPEDVAAMVVFLCSAANTHTTGEAVRTDGHFLSPT